MSDDILTAEKLAEIEARTMQASKDMEGLHSSDYSASMATVLDDYIPALLASHKAQAAEIERLTKGWSSAITTLREHEARVAELEAELAERKSRLPTAYAWIYTDESGRQQCARTMFDVELLSARGVWVTPVCTLDAALGAKP